MRIKIANIVSDISTSISMGGKNATSQIDIVDRVENDYTDSPKLVNALINLGHESVLEHGSISLAIQDVSIVVEHFLIDKRLASFTIKSRRYVDFSDKGYVIPELKSTEFLELYKNNMDNLFNSYTMLVKNGIPKEDARYILPYCCKSSIYMTTNVREWRYIIKKALISNIQEIIDLGMLLLKTLSEETAIAYLFKDIYDTPLNPIPCRLFKVHDQTKYDQPFGKLIKCGDMNTLIELYHKYYKIDDLEEDQVVNYLLDSDHRVLEGIPLEVEFRGISMAVSTHVQRHRMQSLFTRPPELWEMNFDFIEPPFAKKYPFFAKIYYNAIQKHKSFVTTCLNNFTVDQSIGVYFILAGMKTNMRSHMNLRQFRKLCGLRMCTKAQWEIRNFMNDLHKQLPLGESKDCIGPNCILTGKCKEAKPCKKEFSKTI